MLLGRKTAKELGVLRVGLAADVYFTGGLTKNKFRENILSGVHWSWLKNYKLTLNIDEGVSTCEKQT